MGTEDTCETASWVQSLWLSLPSWKGQRPAKSPPSWVNCIPISFLYTSKICSSIGLQRTTHILSLALGMMGKWGRIWLETITDTLYSDGEYSEASWSQSCLSSKQVGGNFIFTQFLSAGVDSKWLVFWKAMWNHYFSPRESSYRDPGIQSGLRGLAKRFSRQRHLPLSQMTWIQSSGHIWWKERTDFCKLPSDRDVHTFV